jgi:hypothetical protein
MVRGSITVLAVAFVLANGPTAQAGGGCELFGEIAVEAVKAKATEACVVTKHPVACAVAAALNTAAGDGLAKKGTTAGCEWAVEKVGDLLKVTIKADAKHAAEAKKAEVELKKAKGYKVPEKKK